MFGTAILLRYGHALAVYRDGRVLPVPRSLALTPSTPFASMSKAISICGTPFGAGAIPASSMTARDELC